MGLALIVGHLAEPVIVSKRGQAVLISLLNGLQLGWRQNAAWAVLSAGP
jgi:hypothetical protein